MGWLKDNRRVVVRREQVTTNALGRHWIGICIAVGVLSACGFRNDPIPVTRVIPATQGQRAWFREDRILISWRVPEPDLVRRRGAVQSYEVIVRQVPLACTECGPGSARHIVLNRDSPDLTVENPTVYYQWKPVGPPVQWLIQVRTHFQYGDSLLGPALIVAEPNETPVHVFSFETIKAEVTKGEATKGETTKGETTKGEATKGEATKGEATKGEATKRSRQVRLFWQPRQERVVHVVTLGGGHFERPVFYRANVYQRLPPAPWPFSPLNDTPLDTLDYLIQLPAFRARGGPDQVEYTIRLVDEFGNEGPAAPPLRFGPASGETG